MFRKVLMALAFAWVVLVSPARAEWVQFEKTLAGKAVTVSYNGATLTVFAGQYQAHLYHDPALTNSIAGFYSFCVDFDHSMTVGQVFQVNVVSTDTLSHGAEVAYLYQKYGMGLITGNNKAAALQLAIWDLIIDGGDGFGVGNFRYGTLGTALTLANQFLDEARGQAGHTFWLDASPSGTARNRGQSTLYPHSAPEPSSACLFALGGLGFWLRRRRANRPLLTSPRMSGAVASSTTRK
jgi:hypothetical protein